MAIRMTDRSVVYEVDGPVAMITLNRPEKVNARRCSPVSRRRWTGRNPMRQPGRCYSPEPAAASVPVKTSRRATPSLGCLLWIWESHKLADVGFIDGFPVGKYLRDARVTTLYEGTSQIQKLIIGRHLTGINAFT
jgi:hypothetical protein